MGKRLTQIEYINEANIIHNNFYDYSKFIYINSHVKGIVICPIHGEFKIRPYAHLNGQGCKECGIERMSKSKTYTQREMLQLLLARDTLNQFDYGLLDYKGYNIPIQIKCKICNDIFPQTPHSHLSGYGCPSCGGTVRLTLDEFINRSNIIHNYFYDYSISKYINSASPIDIICPIHGKFSQIAGDHLNGCGCRECSIESAKYTTQEFIDAANLIHNHKFRYPDLNYTDNKTLITIICPEHGKFTQLPYAHLQGNGCRKCGHENTRNSSEYIIHEANKVHNFKYTYGDMIYNGMHMPILITCSSHGNFLQAPYSHLAGSGCPKCKNSKGESVISSWLSQHNLTYTTEKTYDGLLGVGNRNLRYDFHVPTINVLIEFDGEQHFKAGNFKGTIITEEQFHKTQEHDRRKTEYAKNNNIKLLRIPYWDMNKIPEILSKNLTLITK